MGNIFKVPFGPPDKMLISPLPGHYLSAVMFMCEAPTTVPHLSIVYECGPNAALTYCNEVFHCAAVPDSLYFYQLKETVNKQFKMVWYHMRAFLYGVLMMFGLITADAGRDTYHAQQEASAAAHRADVQIYVAKCVREFRAGASTCTWE